MKRALRIVIIATLAVVGGTALWCTAYPLLFPGRAKASQDRYQQWVADHPIPEK